MVLLLNLYYSVCFNNLNVLNAVNLHTNTVNINVKPNCLLLTMFLFISVAISAQRRNDTAFHAIKMSKDSIKIVPMRLLAQDYYAVNLGFFCKTEIMVQKTVKFPVKFRLGSVSYCDAIEGKSKNYAMLPR